MSATVMRVTATQAQKWTKAAGQVRLPRWKIPPPGHDIAASRPHRPTPAIRSTAQVARNRKHLFSGQIHVISLSNNWGHG